MSNQDPQYYDFRNMLEESKKLEPMTTNEAFADRVYRDWGKLVRKHDIVEQLKARYALSISESGGPAVDVISRAAYEEIEKLRRQLSDMAGF